MELRLSQGFFHLESINLRQKRVKEIHLTTINSPFMAGSTTEGDRDRRPSMYDPARDIFSMEQQEQLDRSAERESRQDDRPNVGVSDQQTLPDSNAIISSVGELHVQVSFCHCSCLNSAEFLAALCCSHFPVGTACSTGFSHETIVKLLPAGCSTLSFSDPKQQQQQSYRGSSEPRRSSTAEPARS